MDPRYNTNSGIGLACGDMDRDGYDDVVIGTSQGSELMLVSGAAALPDTILLTDTSVKRLRGAGVGWRICLADFNGDQNLDIISNANWYPEPPGCQSCGGDCCLRHR
jgi:hypothetical protein